MLETRILGPADGDGGTALVLLHGRGADPDDLASLQRWLPENLTVLLPRAPFAGAQWGYGPGWAWYRYIGGDQPDAETYRSAQGELDALLESVPSVLGHEPAGLFLGGFSQGGTMSLGRALRRPEGLMGVLNFSGFVPDHPDVPLEGARNAPPVFWGHGTSDPAIPFELAAAGRDRLREHGAELEFREYSMGHGILPQELADARAWIERILASG